MTMEKSELGLGAWSQESRLRWLLDQYERGLIVLALQAAGGSQKRAAEALRLLPTTLHEKMKRFGLLGSRSSRQSAEMESSPSTALSDDFGPLG